MDFEPITNKLNLLLIRCNKFKIIINSQFYINSSQLMLNHLQYITLNQRYETVELKKF